MKNALARELMQKALALDDAICIIRSMRTHQEIVKAAGKPEEVATKRGVSPFTVRSWIVRDSIPSEHWAAFAEDGLATLEELAEYEVIAAARRRAERLAEKQAA